MSITDHNHIDLEALDVPLEPLIEPTVTPNAAPKNLPLCKVNISRQRIGHFHGREDTLQTLKTKLLTNYHTVILYGAGGLGKSEIALDFVHSHGPSFDAVLWIQSDNVTKLRQEFSRYAAELGLEEGKDETDPNTSRELVKNWLKAPIKRLEDGSIVGAKWLIVFDGADSPGILQEFNSLHGRGSILITSQTSRLQGDFRDIAYHDCSVGISGLTALELQRFSEDEAIAVLKTVAGIGPDEETEAAKQIVPQLGFMPLTINQMGAIIHTHRWSLQEFYENWKEHTIRHDLDPEATMASMRVAYLSKQATALLQVCSMLDHDCIQESMFAEYSAEDSSLQDFPLTSKDFARARTELLNASLLGRHRLRRELWMHPDFQRFVRGQCSNEVFNAAFHLASEIVKTAWKPPEETVRDYLKLWQPCSAYMRHVMQLQQVYSDDKVKPGFAFAWLLNEVASLQRNLGNTPGLRITLDLALSVCEQLEPRNEGETFELLSEIYHGLGALANETNRAADCMHYNSKYLKMRRDAEEGRPNTTERTAYAWNQYGTSFMMIKDYDQAIKAFETSIALYATLSLDSKCPDSLPKANLGVAKWLVDDFDEAKKILEEGLREREEAFGFMDKESFRTGRFYHTLGNLHEDLGNFRDSDTCHRRALKQYLRTLGHWHHRTADVRYRVAQHCIREGDHVKAGTLIDQALEAWYQDRESFRPEIARATLLKSKQRAAAGELGEAQSLREKAWKKRSKVVPNDLRPASELTDQDFDELIAFWSL